MQAWNKEDITFSKPSSYDGRKRIYVVYKNSGCSDSNLGLGKGIQIRQTQDKAWSIVLTWSGFDKDSPYKSEYQYAGFPNSLRNIKKEIVNVLTNQDRVDEMNNELQIRIDNLKF